VCLCMFGLVKLIGLVNEALFMFAVLLHLSQLTCPFPCLQQGVECCSLLPASVNIVLTVSAGAHTYMPRHTLQTANNNTHSDRHLL